MDLNGATKKRKTTVGTSELYPAAVRAIEEDDLDRMKTLIEIESFTRDSLDELLYKACERSKDICLEEDFIKNEANISNSEEEQSMLSICQTARKNNEQLLDLLVMAESQAEPTTGGDDRHHRGRHHNKRHNTTDQATPKKPVLRSIEKNEKLTVTPEMPKFKSKVRRELKY